MVNGMIHFNEIQNIACKRLIDDSSGLQSLEPIQMARTYVNQC